MKRSTVYQLVDLALDGMLAERLRTWDEAGVSRRAAARLLTIELGGIYIAPDTVARWTERAAVAA